MKKKKLIVCRGLPSSSKSTWAKEYVKNRQNWVRLNNDDLRLMFFDRAFSKQDSSTIEIARDVLLGMLVVQDGDHGKNVIIDNTNLNPKLIEEYKTLACNNNYDFEIKDFTDVPLEECIRRDNLRSKSNGKVGAHVILGMHNRYLKDPNEPDVTLESLGITPHLKNWRDEKVIFEQDSSLPKAIICDLDGTLALMNNRNPYDASTCFEDDVNVSVQKCLLSMQASGYQLIFMSGRPYEYFGESYKFISEKAKIQDFQLYMRATDDSRKDSIIKKELFDEYIKDKYYIEFWLDDRNQIIEMVREMGINCFQVAPGDF
jgi:predicted kinase